MYVYVNSRVREKSINCTFYKKEFGSGKISRARSKLTNHKGACKLLCSSVWLNSVCKHFTHCKHDFTVLGPHTLFPVTVPSLSGVGSGEGGGVVLKATPPSTHLVYLDKHVLRNICGKGGQKLIVLSTNTTKYQILIMLSQGDISPTVRETDDQLKNIDFSFFLLIVYPYLY